MELTTYRSKLLGINECFVVGNLIELNKDKKICIIKDKNNKEFICDLNYLSINFSSLKDINDIPLFASIIEKGGDVIKYIEPSKIIEKEGILNFEELCVNVDCFEFCSIRSTAEFIKINY